MIDGSMGPGRVFLQGRREVGIFELSDLFSVTSEALRKYEAKQILQPYRGENRYRKYSSWELTKLVRIRQLRQAGLSLDDIADELANYEPMPPIRNMETLQQTLRDEIAYREKLIHWMDRQQEEMARLATLGESCATETRGRQFCCVYMVKDTLVNKKGADWEHLKEWMQALPFAKVYYIAGIQAETLSCLVLEEDELERYGFGHLVPDFVLPARSYVVCNATEEHMVKTETTEESLFQARQKALQTGMALGPQALVQMVWYTYQDGIFQSHNKAMFPILDAPGK